MGANYIGLGLKKNQSLLRLSIGNALQASNFLQDSGIKYIFNSLKKNEILEAIILNNNQITEIGTEIISNNLNSNSGIKHIELCIII